MHLKIGSVQRLTKIDFFLLVGIAVTIPLVALPQINGLFIILLILSWLVQRRFVFKNIFLYPFLAFYLIHVIGLFFSTNVGQALFELEKKMSLLVLPVVMYGLPSISEKQFKTVLMAFVISCFIASVICLGHATYQYFLNNTTDYFFYHPLSKAVGMHAIYMAMYVVFSMLIIIYLYWQSDKPMVGVKVIFYLSLIYLTVFLFLLSARAEIAAFCIIVFSGILVYYKKRKQLLMALGIIGLLILSFASLVYFSQVNLERFKEAINYNSEYSISKQWGGRAERLLMWDCSWDLMRDNFLFGVGTGDAQDELQKCYTQKDYNALLFYKDTQYNAHNQFFQTTIDTGVFGLISFLVCLITAAFHAMKTNDYLFLSFLVLFSIASLTESMLEANKGIVFFAFFASLFLFQQGVKPKLRAG